MVSKTVFTTPWFSIDECEYKNDNTQKPYYVIKARDGVVCLPFTKKGELVMVCQYRPTLQRSSLEFPAGDIEQDETPKQAVIRELIEETGYECQKLKYITAGRLNMDRFCNIQHFFLGIGATRKGKSIVEKHIETVLVKRSELYRKVQNGEYEQIGALGALMIAEKKFGIDLLHSDMDHIENALDK